MSFREELLPLPVRGNGRQEAVDSILRQFFRSAMPDPWPAWKAPAEKVAVLPQSSRRPLFWSRFALAASVALLLASQLWLAKSYRPPEPSETTNQPGPVDVATKPQVSSSGPDAGPETTPGGRASSRPVLKNMR